MAQHKLNTFHWHLIDDHGWRIEIKKYPKLTEVGAWRKTSASGSNTRTARPTGRTAATAVSTPRTISARSSPTRHGGYMTIVPEIEMPGHSRARRWRPIPQLRAAQGPHRWLEDVYCAGNDATFAFLDDVLDGGDRRCSPATSSTSAATK